MAVQRLDEQKRNIDFEPVKATKKAFASTGLLCALCMILIAVFRLIHMRELIGPSILNDEAGYWSHAANLAGLNWKEVLWLWYSYGYSLLLTPVLWVTKNITIAYKIAIIGNILMVEAMFWMGIKIVRKLEPDVQPLNVIIFSFIATCYPAYLLQSQAAWSETLVYLGYMVVIYACILFIESQNIKNTLLFSVSVGLLYIIHNRTLSVVAALFVFIILQLFRKRVSWKYLAIMGIIFGVLFFINILMKRRLSLLMWDRTDGFGGNDISSNKGNVMQASSMDGIVNLIYSLLGKSWYLVTATCGLAFCGFEYLLYPSLKSIIRQSHNTKNELCLFVILTCLATIAVCAIAMLNASIERMDVLIYGRYMDMICGPLILFGLLYIHQGIDWKRIISVCAVFIQLFIILSLVVQQRVLDIGCGERVGYNRICIPGVCFFHEIDIKKISFVSMELFACIVVWVTLTTNKRWKRYISGSVARVVLALICCVPFFAVYQTGFSDTISRYQLEVKEIYDNIKPIREHPDTPLFIMEENRKMRDIKEKTDYRARWATLTRLLAMESTIIYGNPSETEYESYFLLLPIGVVEGEKGDYRLVAYTEEYCLLAHGEVCDRLKEAGYRLQRNYQKLIDAQTE